MYGANASSGIDHKAAVKRVVAAGDARRGGGRRGDPPERRLAGSPGRRACRGRRWAVRRPRLAHDETMAIEDLHVPREVLPDLRREALEEHSFYELLRELGGTEIAFG